MCARPYPIGCTTNEQSSSLVIVHFSKRQIGAVHGERVVHPFFHRSDGSLLRHLGIASSSGAVRFGSLKSPMAPFTVPWAPLGFALSQALCLGSPDFVANCLDTLRVHANKWSFKQIRVLFLLNSILLWFTFSFKHWPLRHLGLSTHNRSRPGPSRDAPPCVHHSLSFSKMRTKSDFCFSARAKGRPVLLLRPK